MTNLNNKPQIGDLRINSPTSRCFIAIPIDTLQRKILADLLGYLRKQDRKKWICWAKPNNLHLTMHFLGDIDAANIIKLQKALQTQLASLSTFTLVLNQLILFPTKQRPHVVAYAIQVSPVLNELYKQIETAVTLADLAAETRAFKPHLTLGRFRQPKKANYVIPLQAPPLKLKVEEVVLYQSEFKNGGVEHVPLSSIRLAQA